MITRAPVKKKGGASARPEQVSVATLGSSQTKPQQGRKAPMEEQQYVTRRPSSAGVHLARSSARRMDDDIGVARCPQGAIGTPAVHDDDLVRLLAA